ncbi:VanW family protein, partial [Candidatus Gottesmanbacteria bacterium]|nr:VanW family protein [Candidatus Gottesmanbacteria bacterium]
EDVLPSYQDKTIKPTNAHFNAQDGFKFSGLYFGDGICHIASLIYWVALEAGLPAERPANHDFAVINEVPKEYGVSIYYMPGSPSANAQQNLYITNSRDADIQFVFDYDGQILRVRIVK